MEDEPIPEAPLVERLPVLDLTLPASEWIQYDPDGHYHVRCQLEDHRGWCVLQNAAVTADGSITGYVESEHPGVDWRANVVLLPVEEQPAPEGGLLEIGVGEDPIGSADGLV